MNTLLPSIFLFIFMLFLGCEEDENTRKNTPSEVEIKFLDEYIYPENQIFKGTKIGGLSGIDYVNGTYYIVTDDFNKPRYYKAKINIQNKKINSVSFTDVVVFNQKQEYYSSNFLDLESIVVQNGNVIISSEGNVRRNKKPSIFTSNAKGDFMSEYAVPNYFLTESRENGVFESLTKSFDNQGIWSVNELPLKTDGTKAKYPKTNSPLRFTYYNSNTKQPTKEFIYELSPLPLPKTKLINMNGVSDILEYKENEFLVLERAFQGRNIVKIFKVVIEENSTNSLNIKSLKSNNYTPIKKELLFNFDTIKSQLIHQKIDNIEGITFGETLPNGNKTLIVISDDNFQKFGSQMNQFILLELIEK